MHPIRLALTLTAVLAVCNLAGQVQQQDAAYAEKIKAYTTDERFISDLVDHLPLSAEVTSPLAHFGDITEHVVNTQKIGFFLRNRMSLGV